MEFNIQIDRGHVHMILFVLVLGFASVLVFSTSTPTQGHSAGEITPGTFAGGGDYIFPAGSNLDLGSNQIMNVELPTDGMDAANKNYVDAATGGVGYIDWNDCERKTNSGCNIGAHTTSCSAGYVLVDHGCTIWGDAPAASGGNAECWLSAVNSITMSSTGNTCVYGSIKCCKYITP